MNPLRILVIDDHKAHAEGLAELLALNGFVTFHAPTGNEGLEIAMTQPLDAVLLDMQLPDMNGYDVCDRLRSEPRTANLAIIFHTGSNAPVRVEHDADAFLTYPVRFSDLFSVIQGCVARRRSTAV